MTLIVDIPATAPFAECRRVLAPDGTYVLMGTNGYDAGRWLTSRAHPSARRHGANPAPLPVGGLRDAGQA